MSWQPECLRATAGVERLSAAEPWAKRRSKAALAKETARNIIGAVAAWPGPLSQECARSLSIARRPLRNLPLHPEVDHDPQDNRGEAEAVEG
eukprot:4967190-Alexandrium_andersonii.AAC.1